MPIKIFSAPGDHRDDFEQIELQYNAWEAEHKPRVLEIQSCVEKVHTQRDLGSFMLTLVVRYEDTAGA